MGSPQAAAGFLLYSISRRDSNNDSTCFDTTSLSNLRDIKADDSGRLTCILPVTRSVQNRMGTLHGGCTATLIDVVGTAALLTQSKRGGVSLNINTNYLSPMPGGGDCIIDARIVRIGRQIATINVDLRDAATGKLVAQGTHVKFISDSEPDLSRLAVMLDKPPPLPEPPIEKPARVLSTL